jgi:hypothetical protein
MGGVIFIVVKYDIELHISEVSIYGIVSERKFIRLYLTSFDDSITEISRVAIIYNTQLTANGIKPLGKRITISIINRIALISSTPIK